MSNPVFSLVPISRIDKGTRYRKDVGDVTEFNGFHCRERLD
jgi:hypothetical protein